MKGVDAYGKRGMALLSLWELKELLAGGISGPPEGFSPTPNLVHDTRQTRSADLPNVMNTVSLPDCAKECCTPFPTAHRTQQHYG